MDIKIKKQELDTEVTESLNEVSSKQDALPDKTGHANKVLAVNTTEDGFEYVECADSSTPLLPDHVSIKNIVFMIGDDLLTGGQEHTEIYVPLTGSIKNIYVSVGMSSDHTSNLQVSIQKFSGTAWSTMESITIPIEDRLKVVDTDLAIENDRLRINLISGDFANVSNLSVVASVHV